MAKAIVLMTALVPTIGHKYLIDFAFKLNEITGLASTVHVIVGTLDREPVPGFRRVNALRRSLYHSHIQLHHLDRDVPQEPSEHPDFWNVWRDIVLELVGEVNPDDCIVASELYGIEMAKVLGCKFMPCNIYREILPIKGSDVRKDILGNFDKILPEFQPYLRKTVTIFGPESCGKTTMSKRLAKDLNGWFVPEWAREYLEVCGTEITNAKMAAIVDGQFASQKTVQELSGKPWIFQDTDLLSTIGYYRLWGGSDHDNKDIVTKKFEKSKSDLYVVMSDQIPFEEDPIRYGGTKRESNCQFWIDLLEEFGCPYVVVDAADHETQTAFLTKYLLEWYNNGVKHIQEYER